MVEIDRDDIAKVVKPLASGYEPGIHILQSRINEALLPLIDTYGRRADRGQKVGKEIRCIARELVEEMGFQPYGVWYKKVGEDYLGKSV